MPLTYLDQPTIDWLAGILSTRISVTFPAAVVFNVKTYGAVGDGTADDSTAVQAAITAAGAVGGTVYFPSATYRINSQLTFPNDGASTPNQRPIKLMGDGELFAGQWSAAAYGGSILDLRYSGSLAKIVTKGNGVLSLTNLTLTDLGTSSTAFIYTTNTTLIIHECAFIGNPSKSGVTCNQDAIILGGQGTVVGGSDTAPFQGYGTVIENNYFSRIQRAVLGQTFCNGTVIRSNTISITCGSTTSGFAAIQFSPATGNYCTGNVVSENLIEMTGYKYGIRLEYSTVNSIVHNNFFDPVVGTLGYIKFDTNAIFNLAIAGWSDDTYPTYVDTPGSNTIIQTHQNKYSVMSQPILYTNSLGATFSGPGIFTTSTGPAAIQVQPSADQSDSTVIIQAKRSAASSNPGTNIFWVQQNGTIQIGGVGAGNIDCYAADGTTLTSRFTGNLKNWIAAGVGGGMSQDSGTGGSFFDHKNFAVRFFDHNSGPLRMKIGAGIDGFALGASSDANLYRSAANVLKTDSSLFVVGNVGFNGTSPVAKPTVTGSKGANAALASLLTALANTGLITDSST